MRRSYWLWVCAAVGFAILGLLILRTSSGFQTVRLADGRTLTIAKLTFGTEHKFATGNLLSKVAGPVLSAKWKAKFGVRTVVVQTPPDSMVVWGVWQFLTNGGPTPFRATIMETNGDAEFNVTRRSGATMPNGEISGWQVENFPRRAKTFRFIVSEVTNTAFKPIASFDLPNPAPREFPVWKPPPLPVSQSHQGLEFEAVNFVRTYPNLPWWAAIGQPMVRTGYVALFRVRQQDRVLDNWQIEQITILDATGNRITPRVRPSFMLGEYLFLGLPLDQTPLWPSEKAWKLIPQFTRTAGFASNELGVLRGIPLPTSMAGTQVVVHTEANGVLITGLTLKTVADYRLQENLVIETVLQLPPEREINLVDVLDERGRGLRHARASYPLDGKHFGVELLPDSKSLVLTFAIQKPVTPEFLVGLSEPRKRE